MGKAIVRMFLFNIPFFLISGFMFYNGFASTDSDLTSDGYSAKTFYFLMGAGFLVFPLGVSIVILALQIVKQKRLDELMATGKQGTATILQLSDTGVKINDNPRIKLLLEVNVPDYQTYRTQKTVTLPLIYLPQVQTGSTVNVLVDPAQPANEKKIALLLK